MATVLTVHGTYASGPERGEKWWQSGSAFEANLRELVDADDGELQWKPSIWDGLNSEIKRRAAGAKLYSEMRSLELRGEPYCVIGHSHGGSVISAALIEAAGKSNTLEHLSTWFTVGTPFVSTKRDRFLFSRLGQLGKAVYSGLILGALVSAVATSLNVLGEVWEMLGFINISIFEIFYALLLYLAIIVAPLLLIYVIARFRDRERLPLYRAKIVQFAASTFAPRWVSLCHPNDEAVQGLKSLQTFDTDIFSKRFAVPAVRPLLIALLVLVAVLPLYSPTLMNKLYDLVGSFGLEVTFASNLLGSDGKLLGEGSNVFVNAMLFLTVLGQSLAVPFAPLISWAKSTWDLHALGSAWLKAFLIVIPSSFCGIALMLLVQITATGISQLLSKLLNPVAVDQIKAAGFGSDTDGDKAIGATDFPMWLPHGLPPLPEELSNEIEDVSDAAAAAAISKFRGALKNLSLAKEELEASDIFAHNLTWDELIHTTYFNVPRFRKLVGYAIGQSGGFRPTPAFTRDPDYALVARWHEAIVAARTKAG